MRLSLLALLLAAGCRADAPPEPLAPPPPAPTRAGSDWPKFLGPAGDGSSAETGILTAWPKEGLKKLWHAPLGVGYAPPVVVGERLLHFDRHGDAARLTCRDAETGGVVWKYEYPTGYEDLYGYDPGPRAGPLVDGERVYLHGVEGMVACVNLADGKELWRADTKAAYHFHQNFFGVGSAPLVVGDRLIVPVGGSPKGARPVDLRDARGNGTGFVVFDKLSGKVLQTFNDELASYSSPILATLHGKPTGLYFGRGGLVGFDPAAGTQRFRFPWRSKMLESVNAANPVVVGNEILVSDCYENGAALVRVKPDFGLETVWSDAGKDRGDKALLAHWCTPIADNGVVYGCSGRNANDAELVCFDWATGEVHWRQRRVTRSTLLKVEGHLLVLGEQGQLRLVKLNPAKYDLVAETTVPGIGYPSWTPPVLSRGRLYVVGQDEDDRTRHRLVCLELAAKK